MDASSGASIFSTKPVPWLKEYLKQRGIQTSGKRKNELVELCVKSEEIKVPKISEEEEPVDPAISMKEQPKTSNNYLVGKDPGYNAESLKSYKSLLGYKLYFDGHVEDLCYHPPQSSASSYSYFLFAVKPTERSKADDGSATYKGFFILKKDGSVHSAYCPCKGGYVFSFTLTIR